MPSPRDERPVLLERLAGAAAHAARLFVIAMLLRRDEYSHGHAPSPQPAA